MNLIVFHEKLTGKGQGGLLQSALSSNTVANIIVKSLLQSISPINGTGGTVIAMPEAWSARKSLDNSGMEIKCYNGNLPVSFLREKKVKKNTWITLSNGCFAISIDHKWLQKIITNLDADVIAINVTPELKGYREKVLIDSHNNVVGFQRLYSDSTRQAPVPSDWPHLVMIRTKFTDTLLVNEALPLAFPEFISQCTENNLKLYGLEIAGLVLDLEAEEDFLAFIGDTLGEVASNKVEFYRGYFPKDYLKKEQNEISPQARLFGNVILGHNVSIEPDAIVIGPAIIADKVKIRCGAVVKSSIIGPGLSIPKNHLVQNRVLLTQQDCLKKSLHNQNAIGLRNRNGKNLPLSHKFVPRYKIWPMFSYARFFKRLADIVFASLVLILFAPILPFIVLAIKLNAPGPVFYKDRRQGRYGKEFNCLKFRSMRIDADKMQDKLRCLNQVDGPQFKIENDPRITSVGRFLRDTYIDEIPQFLSVLAGQMSVVGPRPSPEAENILCPYWHDARLSVRPGITGLWQVCRTRESGQDFQEWIYHDTRYVKNLSWKKDLWICYKTAKKLIWGFIRKF